MTADASIAYINDDNCYGQSEKALAVSDAANDTDVSTITTNDDIIKKMGCKSTFSALRQHKTFHRLILVF